MRHVQPPFQFDISDILDSAHRHAKKRITGIAINLPFISISVRPNDIEQRIAREIIIRLSDKRVLNAFECCDECIDRALKSLQNIRTILVDKQVELSGHVDGALYIILELMLAGIRQFFTFEDSLAANRQQSMVQRRNHGQYLAALEMLRAHLYRCLAQAALIADIKIPKISANMRYDTTWQVEAYQQPRAAKIRDI